MCRPQKKIQAYVGGQLNSFLPRHSVRSFPAEKLHGEVALLRFDSSIFWRSQHVSLQRTVSTIKYLNDSGAKVVLLTSWDAVSGTSDPILCSLISLADYLSSILKAKVVPVDAAPGLMALTKEHFECTDIILLNNVAEFEEESSNSLNFSEKLASGITIFVNDAFALSHKILASTVGVTHFCYASLAGFNFEEELNQLLQIINDMSSPYIAVIGGSNFSGKAAALHLLASKCDHLFFVGSLSFQIMKSLGLPVPDYLVEESIVESASKLIQIANERNTRLSYPSDFICVQTTNPELTQIIQSDELLPGWKPFDIGPMSIKTISSMVPWCKKILWVGSTECASLSKNVKSGASQLAIIVEKASQNGSDVTCVGRAACDAVAEDSYRVKKLHSASVVWEFLKGRPLPGFSALDMACPSNIKWDTIFTDPTKSLIVDIGSGNGLFLFKMAKKWEDSNFLGLEINKMLVRRCCNGAKLRETKNIHFLNTNATSTFYSLVSTYPGDLTLVTIQCPNPDFKKERNRWKMVRRMLVESIVDLLASNGKVFLQSDVESVLIGMKEQFLTFGKNRVVVDGDTEDERMQENPFGATSDWEQHTLARGGRMYRTMLRKL